MKKYIKNFKSLRIKLFVTLCIIVAMVVVVLVIVNNIVLEKLYLYNKTRVINEICRQINEEYNNGVPRRELEEKIKTISIKNNLDFIINDNEGNIVAQSYGYDKELDSFDNIEENADSNNKLYDARNVYIELVKIKDIKVSYIVAKAKLDNGFLIQLKTTTVDLQESARISNNVLIAIGSASILISGIISLFVSKKFTEPISELESIAKKMSNLDFSQKYNVDGSEDEINNLGKSINTMSEKLEKTIKQLTANNTELEKDIERKSKIDEMRKQFISDVSHELKTPIALIQGYAEGLVENVNKDDESRQFYANVILDEVNKMDRLVKQLLELMKLENGKRQFVNDNFDITALIKNVIKKSEVMLKENDIKIYFEHNDKIKVYADIFYIEQILINYLTNAIKYSKEENGERKIIVDIQKIEKNNKIRITMFNSGDNLDEAELQRIWGRFYKVDSSRNRENGGTGIGLAFVKAIMNNYKNDYGAVNKEGGIEFFFDIDAEFPQNP